MLGWGRARTCAGLVVGVVILGFPGLGSGVEVGGWAWEGMGADAGAAGSGRGLGGDTGRGGRWGGGYRERLYGSFAGTSGWRGLRIGVRRCPVERGLGERAHTRSFPSQAGWRVRWVRGKPKWLVVIDGPSPISKRCLCGGLSLLINGPVTFVPFRLAAFSRGAVGEERLGCRRSFSGRVGEGRSAASGVASWPAG